MSSARFTRSVAIDGNTYQSSFDVTGQAKETVDPSVTPGAQGGVLTARTDNDTGSVTFQAGHGFITGDLIDIYWNVGGVIGSRRAMVATMTGDVAALDGGAGDNLPALNTTGIVGKKPQKVDSVFTGDNVTCFVVSSSVPGWIVFMTAGNAVIAAYRLSPTIAQFSWNNVEGLANPLAGAAVGKVAFSHNDASANVMRAIILYN